MTLPAALFYVTAALMLFTALRTVTATHIFRAALYLAADASAMVTGSALMLDGGWSAGK